MLYRSQHFNDLQIVPSCNNSQCALARGWNEIVGGLPFGNSLGHTELCQPRLRQYDSIELSLVHSLYPSFHISKERFRLHVRPHAPELCDSDRVTRSDPATYS